MPPVYYINLDRRPDRRAHMEAELARVGLAAERISAVTISEIGEAELARRCDPARADSLTPSQLACTLSHLKTWRRFLETGSGWALILEDDVLMSPRLAAFASAFPASASADDLDLVHIEATARSARVLPRGETIAGSALRRFVSTQWGSAAYLISRGAAEKLLASKHLFSGPTDQMLFRPYTLPGRGLRLALADPALCIQIHKLESSEVAQGNLTPVHQRAGSGFARWWRTVPPFLASVGYHFTHRRAGISREVIPFDLPGQRYRGSKLASYGTELRD